MICSEHARAFRAWHVDNLTRTAPHWHEPPLNGLLVKPQLRRCDSFLKLRVERDAVSVAAEWDWEEWDVVFAAQARITYHDGFYTCEHEPDERSAPIERLWEQWLYEPLIGWAESTLAQAAVMYFCKRGDTRWATLAPHVMTVPEDAIYAVCEQ